jgi:hypothetical protein
MHPIPLGNAIAVAATVLAIAGVLIALITSNQRTKHAKLDFLRNAMERGVTLDPQMIDNVMRPNKSAAGKQPLPRGQGARVAGILVIAFGIGYVVFACLIALVAPTALLPMLGVACLFLCIGIGLLVVSKVLRSDQSVTGPKE